MILGETECDYDIACFLKNGKYPQVIRNSKYGLTKNDIDYHLHNSQQDEYYCWQGTRIPCWFE